MEGMQWLPAELDELVHAIQNSGDGTEVDDEPMIMEWNSIMEWNVIMT